MKMTSQASALSLFLYSVLCYFFWISNNIEMAVAGFAFFLVLSVVMRSLKKGLTLLLVVGLTHALYWGMDFIPYLQWPFDFYLLAFVGFAFVHWGLQKKSLALDRASWSFQFTKKQWLSVFIINVPAVLVLIWYYSNHKDIAQQWPLPDLPTWSIPLVVILIAAINGLREEIFYRGLLQTVSEEHFPLGFVLIFQALFFGTLHFSGGFPQGWLGVGLTAIWGVAIAMQYHLYRSIALAWLTHATADALMFGIILYTR